MTDREKLVELLDEAENQYLYHTIYGCEVGNYGLDCPVRNRVVETSMPEPPKVDLADIFDIDKQNKDSSAVMRKVIDFVREGLER